MRIDHSRINVVDAPARDETRPFRGSGLRVENPSPLTEAELRKQERGEMTQAQITRKAINDNLLNTYISLALLKMKYMAYQKTPEYNTEVSRLEVMIKKLEELSSALDKVEGK